MALLSGANTAGHTLGYGSNHMKGKSEDATAHFFDKLRVDLFGVLFCSFVQINFIFIWSPPQKYDIFFLAVPKRTTELAQFWTPFTQRTGQWQRCFKPLPIPHAGFQLSDLERLSGRLGSGFTTEACTGPFPSLLVQLKACSGISDWEMYL